MISVVNPNDWQEEKKVEEKKKMIKISENYNVEDEMEKIRDKDIGQMKCIMYRLLHSDRIRIISRMKFDSRYP